MQARRSRLPFIEDSGLHRMTFHAIAGEGTSAKRIPPVNEPDDKPFHSGPWWQLILDHSHSPRVPYDGFAVLVQLNFVHPASLILSLHHHLQIIFFALPLQDEVGPVLLISRRENG